MAIDTTASLLREHTRVAARFVTCAPHKVPWFDPDPGEGRTGCIFDLCIVTSDRYICWTPAAGFATNAEWLLRGNGHVAEYMRLKLQVEL